MKWENSYLSTYKWFSKISLKDKIIKETEAILSIPLMIYSTMDTAVYSGFEISEKSKTIWLNDAQNNLYLLNFRQIKNNLKVFKQFIQNYEYLNEEGCIKKLFSKLNSFSNYFNGANCLNDLLSKYCDLRFTNSSTCLYDYHVMTCNLFEDMIFEIPNEVAKYLCLGVKIKSTREVNYLPKQESAEDKIFFKKIENGKEINLGLQNFTEAVYESLSVPIPQSCLLIVSFFEDGSFQDPYHFVVTEGVPGEKIEETKLENKEYELDSFNTSLQFLMTFLTEPGDGNEGNYIYYGKFKTFIPIDNDDQFVIALPKPHNDRIQTIYIKYYLSLLIDPRIRDYINMVNIDSMVEFLKIKMTKIKSSYDDLTKNTFPTQILSNLLTMKADQAFKNIIIQFSNFFHDQGSINFKISDDEKKRQNAKSILNCFRNNYKSICLTRFSINNNGPTNLIDIHKINLHDGDVNVLINSMCEKIFCLRPIINNGFLIYEKINTELFEINKSDSKINNIEFKFDETINKEENKYDLIWLFQFYTSIIKDKFDYINIFLDHVFSYLNCFVIFHLDYEQIKDIYEILEHQMNSYSKLSLIDMKLWDLVWKLVENQNPNFKFFRYFLNLTDVNQSQSEMMSITNGNINNQIYFIEGNFKYRTFKNDCISKNIFYTQEDGSLFQSQLRTRDGSLPGRSVVIPFPSKGPPEIYFKLYPEFPLLEKISIKFMNLIKFENELIPEGMLIILKLRIKKGVIFSTFSSEKYCEMYIPVYLSRAIQGDLLFKHRLWKDENFDLKLLDNNNIMKLIIYSLLVNPEDAKEDNFLVQEKNERLFLIPIDNDHAFLPCSTDYKSNSHRSRVDSNLVLKNLVLCLPQMIEIIPDEIKYKLIRLLKDNKFLIRLSSFIAKYETRYSNTLEIFKKFELEWNENFSFINVSLNESYIEELVFRIAEIPKLMHKNEITFLQIMQGIDSYMYRKYQQVFEIFPNNVKKRFEEFYKNHAKQKIKSLNNNNELFHTSINSSKHNFEIFTGTNIDEWRKENKNKCLTDSIIIDKIDLIVDNRLKIRKILERYEIQNELLDKDGFFQKIGVISTNEEKAFRDLLNYNQFPETIGIFNTVILNSYFLNRFLSQVEIQPRVKMIDFRNGLDIDDGVINLIKKYFPNLEYLNLSNCNKLKHVFINDFKKLIRLRLISCSNLISLKFLQCSKINLIEFNSNSDSLIRLTLKKCNLNEKTIEFLSHSIRSNKFMKFINFKFNLINDEAIKYLLDSIANNQIIEKINLSYNKITINGLLEILQFLKPNKTIKCVSLWNNLIELTYNSLDQYYNEMLRVDFDFDLNYNLLLKRNSKSLKNYPDEYKPYISLEGHSAYVNCLTQINSVYDKSIIAVASGSVDKKIKIWNICDGTIIKTLEGHSGSVNCITQIKSKGRFSLASGGSDRNILIWNIGSGMLIKTLNGHSSAVNCLIQIKWDKDEFTIASGSYRFILVWNIDSGVIIKTIEIETNCNYIYCLKQINWNKDQFTIASGIDEGEIKIWNITSGNIIKNLTGHSDWVECLTQIKSNINQCTLASGSRDKKIIIWNMDTGTKIKTLTGHTSWVECLTQIKWDKDECTLASGSDDETIIIWNIDTESIIKTLKWHSGCVSCLIQIKCDKDEFTLVSGSWDKKIIIWN